jgi:hypothetical protein
MNSQKIPFDRARAALKQGNPYPFLSRKVEFPSGVLPEVWLRKAEAMFETLESVRTPNVSIRVANAVKEVFVSDPETKNVGLAKKFFGDLIAGYERSSDEDYALFLAAFLPGEQIDEAVATTRENLDHAAAHIRALVKELA